MSLQYQITRPEGLVLFDVRGEASLDDLHGLIDDVARTTRAAGDRRVLVNLLAVGEHLKFTDHYSLGEEVVRKLAHMDRLASVVPRERRTGTSEKVATAHGVQLRVFVSVEEALAWLREDGSATSPAARILSWPCP